MQPGSQGVRKWDGLVQWMVVQERAESSPLSMYVTRYADACPQNWSIRGVILKP